MTWLPVTTEAASDREAVLGLHPEAGALHEEFLQACAKVLDPQLLELCRARMAQTFRCREELARHDAGRLAQVASWPTAPDLSATQRHALAFVDQFVLDPALIPADVVANLEHALGTSGVVDFAAVIAAFEASIRLSTLLDLEPAP